MTNNSNMPTKDELDELLSYDPETGKLTWINPPTTSIKAGTEAGSINVDGYIKVAFRRRSLLAHRVAWTIFYGSPPDGVIDHINHIKTDNRICNLRSCSVSENGRNRRSRFGVKGIARLKNGRFQAQIKGDKGYRYLGTFASIEEAARAYDLAAIEEHGQFAHLNNPQPQAKDAHHD